MKQLDIHRKDFRGMLYWVVTADSNCCQNRATVAKTLREDLHLFLQASR
jgi:hypothetical protein